MGIGVSILLIAVGAILKFATSFYYYGINFDVVGVILMVVGGIGLLAAFMMGAMSRGGERVPH